MSQYRNLVCEEERGVSGVRALASDCASVDYFESTRRFERHDSVEVSDQPRSTVRGCLEETKLVGRTKERRQDCTFCFIPQVSLSDFIKYTAHLYFMYSSLAWFFHII